MRKLNKQFWQNIRMARMFGAFPGKYPFRIDVKFRLPNTIQSESLYRGKPTEAALRTLRRKIVPLVNRPRMNIYFNLFTPRGCVATSTVRDMNMLPGQTPQLFLEYNNLSRTLGNIFFADGTYQPFSEKYLAVRFRNKSALVSENYLNRNKLNNIRRRMLEFTAGDR